MTAPASETEATFGFVDLAGFTALTEVHGDSEAVALLDRFEAIANDSLGLGDRLVKTIGDAVMVVFPRPDAAVAALSRLFVALAETELPVARAGLHHGPAIERGGDYLGASVNLTARVAAQAQGGQVLATIEVADAARISGVAVVDLGCFTLRNITEPVQLFASSSRCVPRRLARRSIPCVACRSPPSMPPDASATETATTGSAASTARPPSPPTPTASLPDRAPSPEPRAVGAGRGCWSGFRS